MSKTSALLFSCFLRHETRRESQKDSPSLPLSFFGKRVSSLCFAVYLLRGRLFLFSVGWLLVGKCIGKNGLRREEDPAPAAVIVRGEKEVATAALQRRGGRGCV